ncbi:MAG: hypothetical protein PHT76_14770, partial [Anaerostipes sp.]|nr:hypothetical protein [Anaerostipes sp.]
NHSSNYDTSRRVDYLVGLCNVELGKDGWWQFKTLDNGCIDTDIYEIAKAYVVNGNIEYVSLDELADKIDEVIQIDDRFAEGENFSLTISLRENEIALIDEGYVYVGSGYKWTVEDITENEITVSYLESEV